MEKITYHKEGDYLIPNLCLPKQPNGHIGKYGKLRLNYLKDFKRGLYTELMINGELSNHLASIDEDATKRVLDIISKLAEAEGIDEKLKQDNQIEWVQAMNNFKNRAEEIVLNEIIYVQWVLNMANFREVNDDILKEWLLYREDEISSLTCDEDKKHWVYFDEISDKILKSIPKQNRDFVRKQLNILDDNFLDYLGYWNEKYYRNGFVDGSQLVMGCFEEQ